MKTYLLLLFILLCSVTAYAQQVTLSGSISTTDGKSVSGATISLKGTNYQTSSDSAGNFRITNIRPGNYTLTANAVGFTIKNIGVDLSVDQIIRIKMQINVTQLKDVTISDKKQTSGIARLKSVEGTAINAGKKNEVIVLDDETANKATNNTRQIYSKVAGLNIWESDGGGIQLGVGGRGLNPNRVTNFNTRQNGYDISADALGYPESYYTPPAELVDRIEILRGASSLQYGTQFGGLINFKLHDANTTQPLEVKSRETAGSWNFFNATNSIDGTVGKVQYYTFFQHKQGDGWRPNGHFNANTGYVSVTYKPVDKLSVTFQYTYMDYLAHQPGGLTDAEFNADPRQSTRTRNWFAVNWNLGAFILDYQISKNLKFNSRTFLLDAGRNAVGNLDYPNRADAGGERNLFVDKYNNIGNESRILYTYQIGNTSQNLLVGLRYYHGHTNRQQGLGSSGNDADFDYSNSTNASNFYTHYMFPENNLAIFAENIFRLTDKLSIIPGVRYENISTSADGSFITFNTDMAGNVIYRKQIQVNMNNSRHFLIGGIGLSYTQSNAIQLYANISQNYRAINFNDLNSAVKGLQVDPNLKDETGYSTDAGIRGGISDQFNYDLSIFMIHYDNRIGSFNTSDANSNDYRLRTNIGTSRNLGMESFAEYNLLKLFPNNQSSKLWLFSNLALINARYLKSKETSANGNKVEMAPDVIFKTGLNLKLAKFSASYQLSYTSSQYTDATNAILTPDAINGLVPAYTVMDFSARYQFNKTFALEGSVNNLADKRYFTRRADSYPGPGIIPSDARSCFLTFEVKLQ